MDYIPLDRTEQKVMRKMLKYDHRLYIKSVSVTLFNVKYNMALHRLCNLGLVNKCDIAGEEQYTLTDEGKRTILYINDTKFWTHANFWLPMITSVLSLIISIVSIVES